MRLGLDWGTDHIAHVVRIFLSCGMLLTNDRFILKSRGALGSYSHASCLLSEQVGGDRSHLLSFDGVRIGDDALSHLIFSALDRV